MWAKAALAILLAVALAACGGSSGGRTSPSTGEAASASTSTLAAKRIQPARWTTFVHVSRPLDVAGPRRDGSIVLAAAGHLALLAPNGSARPFASAYRSPGGEEPYIDVAPPGCFGADVVYALRLRPPQGVVRVSADGRVRQLAILSAPGLIDGIAFDRTGAFGRRLLVTINAGRRTTVEAIDCRGHIQTITQHAPRVEGGLAVAPASFGRFGGDLIAPDEISGVIYAITPGGKSILIGASGLPHGQDIGVESAGFVPAGGRAEALLADRRTPGNRHPGDDVVLGIGRAALAAAGVRAGDLLVAGEGGTLTDAVRCGRAGCQIRRVAVGPRIAHGEGHIAFSVGR